ncbi:ABC transporter permease [Streptomyces sp. NPDC094034]|uniref:ABC transporter permease n=1 Tax=Streptomyces sp. NPDC094034 TaxID=3155309 RepID=UPI00331CA707
MAAFVQLQWLLLTRSPRLLATLVIVPLYALVFFTAVRSYGAPELATTVALTAFSMSMWSQAMFVAAEVVDNDRWDGTLEPSLLTPDAYVRSLVTRICTITALSVPVLVEVIAIGRIGFGFALPVHEPLTALAAALLLVVGTAGSALLVCALMILVPLGRLLQNALTYPFYILGGLLLPVTSLPAPVEWIARLFFLSHGAQLLRDAMTGSGDGHAAHFSALIALSALQLAVGVFLLRRALSRARRGEARLYA